jgi:SulP family sulfate permease
MFLDKFTKLPSLKELTPNIKAGVTVSLISIPLSISLAVASGGTPLQGILTAIWACVIA